MPDYEITHENLARMFGSSDYLERYDAACNLSGTSIHGWKGTKEQADELVGMGLRDAYWATRCEAAKFAYFRGKEAGGAAPALIEALGSEAPAVRAQCVRALGRTGRLMTAMPQIKKMLAAGDQLEAVAWVLWESGASGQAALEEGVDSDNADVRMWSLAGLARGGRNAAAYIKELETALKSGEKDRVISACRSVSLVGRAAAPAGAVLAGLLTDPDGNVRHRASRALFAAAPTDPVVVKALAARLANNDPWDIGGSCMAALGRIGPKAVYAVPAILQSMEVDRSRRFGGLRALARIAPQSPLALPVLLRLLRQSLVKERIPDERVIAAIGAYGPAAEAAVADLVKATKVKGDHPYYVDAAIWALGQIGPAAGSAAAEVRGFIPGPLGGTAQRALKRIAPADPATMPAPDARYTRQLPFVY